MTMSTIPKTDERDINVLVGTNLIPYLAYFRERKERNLRAGSFPQQFYYDFYLFSPPFYMYRMALMVGSLSYPMPALKYITRSIEKHNQLTYYRAGVTTFNQFLFFVQKCCWDREYKKIMV